MFVEYIWIDGATPTQTLRSKTKVIPNGNTLIEYDDNDVATLDLTKLPYWSFDGSSTQQATGESSDCILKPVYVTPDPLRGEGNFLALCEVFLSDGTTPHPTNNRAKVREYLEKVPDLNDAWFGFEQEYTLFAGATPLGFSSDRRFPAPQGPYYCGVGSDQVYGRELVEDHLAKCYAAGLSISGINAEVMPGQWEFQIGPQNALDCSDHLWIARWLLYRIGEEYGVNATLDPKPIPGDWNGAGMHTNFSTSDMREPGGMTYINAFCEMAGKTDRITSHLNAYGDGIESRLTGKHETCSYQEFKYGVSDRTASIRIPVDTAAAGYGYLEDRRPNANACPYNVSFEMLTTAEMAKGVVVSEAMSKGEVY